MSGIAEVGATGVELKEHQCSIKKITVSTKWKDPGNGVPEKVSATVYDNTIEAEEKVLYLISSPKGEKVTIKTEREEGECQRESHKKFQMSWNEYKKEEKEEEGKDDKKTEKKENKDNQSDISYSRIESKFNIDGLALAAAKDAALSSVLPVLLPFNLIRTPIKIEQEIKNESEFKIKCFEIGGAFEALKYLSLPIPLGKETATQFSHISCQEGPIHYQIVSYPDISFKLEISIGTGVKKWGKEEVGEKEFVELSSDGFEVKEAEEENEGTVSGKIEKINEVPGMLKSVVGGLKKKPQFDFSLSELGIAFEANYNGKKSNLEVNFGVGEIIEPFIDKKNEKDRNTNELMRADKDSDKPELLHIKYKHYSFETEFGSQSLKVIWDTIKKFREISEKTKRIIVLFNIIRKICTLDFLKKLYNLAKSDMAKAMVKSYKPYSFELVNPKGSLSAEWKYHTSDDLTKIGKYCEISLSFEPLIGLCFTLDLLFIFLNLVTDGTWTGVYVLIKNLDTILDELLGKDYEKFKEEYGEKSPVEAEIYMKLEATGSVNVSFPSYIVDSINGNHHEVTPIEFEVKLDLKAGAKASVKIFYLVTANIEMSGSGTTGVTMSFGLEDRTKEEEGLSVSVESIFNGMKLKGCIQATVGLKKTKAGFGVEGEKKLWDKSKIDFLSSEDSLAFLKPDKRSGGGR